jgi:uncharacterized membrane protein
MMQSVLHVIGAVAGAIYVLFLPGFAASFLFFTRGAIDAIERIALSFALSVAIVPLISFYLNLVGVKIKFWTVFLEVLAIIIISAVAAKLMGRFNKPSEHKHKDSH